MTDTKLSYLLVEDHEFQRRTLAKMIAGLGAGNVYQAADGREALTIVQDPSTPVDIVISDLEMPGMDGMEFLRHLGEGGFGVSVILVSALGRDLLASIETMTKTYGVRLLGVVGKPLSPTKLVPLIALHTGARAKAKKGGQGPSFSLDEVLEGLRNGEFEPFLQPKVELASRKVRGAEALARWRHPVEGLVAPYAFIPLLEGAGHIDNLMWVMLEKAAACCAAWTADGLDASVSVNLSLKSLGDSQLADRITDVVRSAGLEPRGMILELTESAATTDIGRALENLARLRMRGFGLSIDDYGTGYSSMQQLTRIAFTELKIDQSFVANAGTKEAARVILGSSLDMAKKLGITAVAEGIETQEDWALLRDLGCEVGQGYFIARPMEAARYPAWARAWEASE